MYVCVHVFVFACVYVCYIYAISTQYPIFATSAVRFTFVVVGNVVVVVELEITPLNKLLLLLNGKNKYMNIQTYKHARKYVYKSSLQTYLHTYICTYMDQFISAALN